MGKLKEKCAVFGVYGKHIEVARLTYFGLYALQHRGQESSGIAVSNGEEINVHKKTGLVAQVYSEEILDSLIGFAAIGQNRYSTSGGSHDHHVQPVFSPGDTVVLAHNGNLPDTAKLEKFLQNKKIPIKDLNDSELMQKAVQYFFNTTCDLAKAVELSYSLFTGAFSLLVMSKDSIVAVRDAYGIRPFCLGKLNGGYVFSSETCALDTIGAKFLREINPGEMLVIDKNGLRSVLIEKPTQKLDIFEFVYFSRPDSIMLGKRVHDVRKNLGRLLAKEVKIKADVVIPVPDSSIPAAIGFSEVSKIPFDFGLVKNRYIGRTFILPGQKLRERGVQMKLNPIKDVMSGKRVVVIDDSIVRGTTLKRLVSMVRSCGAKEVHILSSCPPVMFPDFYGIDTPSQKELIASHAKISEIKKIINADTLHYLSYNSLIQATGLSEDVFCTACFTGEYPIDIGKNKKNIKPVANPVK